MHRFVGRKKLTVLSLLIFANSLVLTGQKTDSIYRLPAGTRIRLKLDAEINSKVASRNDTFLAVITQPVKVRDAIALPAGTVVEGRVSDVTHAASGGRDGKLDLVFETLKLSNTTRRLDGFMVTPVTSHSSKTFSVLSIFGGTAIGASAGAASGSSKGTLIGAGIGAAAGSVLALVRKGKEVRIKKGEEFEIELKSEVVLPVLDY